MLRQAQLVLGNRSCRCIAEGKIPRYQQPPSTKLPVLVRSWRSLSCFVLIFLYSRSLPILVQYIEFYTNRSYRPPTTKGDGKESDLDLRRNRRTRPPISAIYDLWMKRNRTACWEQKAVKGCTCANHNKRPSSRSHSPKIKGSILRYIEAPTRTISALRGVGTPR